MNDLSAGVDDESERSRAIVDLRVRGGKTEGEISAMLGCTARDIHSALDRAAQQLLTAQARVRQIYVEQARLESLEEAFFPAAKSGDDKAAMVIIRAQERKATLRSLNAPLRVDPI
jgi:hypothetical protein